MPTCQGPPPVVNRPYTGYWIRYRFSKRINLYINSLYISPKTSLKVGFVAHLINLVNHKPLTRPKAWWSCRIFKKIIYEASGPPINYSGLYLILAGPWPGCFFESTYGGYMWHQSASSLCVDYIYGYYGHGTWAWDLGRGSRCPPLL